MESSRQWLIVHRQDAALLLIVQQVQDKAVRSLENVAGAIGRKGATTGTPLCLVRCRQGLTLVVVWVLSHDVGGRHYAGEDPWQMPPSIPVTGS